MIAGLKPYAEYKESGLPWPGRVPEHWGVRRLKSHLLRNDAGVWGAVFDDRGTPVLRSTEQLVDGGWRIVNPARILLSERQKSAALLDAGDLVITKSSGSALHIGKTSLVTPQVAEMQCCFSNFMQRLRVSQDVSPQFASILLNSRVGREQFVYQSTTTTGLGNVNGTILGNCTFAFPPLAEQATIVRFLDWANRRLDRAIRAKRKVIALLNEQKHAIIHRAVTRGLNSSAPLKPSGIPWLGDIPQHWETPLNQRIFREAIRKHGGAPETQLSLSQRDGLIATADMRERSLQTATYDNWKVTLPGDLVLNRFKAHLGVFFASTLRGIVSFHYGVFAPRRELHAKYFELLFHTAPYRAIYAGSSNGMTVGLQNLSNQNFYNVRCIVPPIDEQAAIIAHTDRETLTLNTTITRLEREIELLREYRTRLVADVVTGKLDVREAAARLPDEPMLEADHGSTGMDDDAVAEDEEILA